MYLNFREIRGLVRRWGDYGAKKKFFKGEANVTALHPFRPVKKEL